MSKDNLVALPLYKKVYEAVIARITSGELGPGAMLPSEFDLAAELGVSQGTARKALIELEQTGVVVRHQGRGTFVSTTTNETALFHFFKLKRVDGTTVLPEPFLENIKKRKVSAKELQHFGTSHKQEIANVFEIDRVRRIDGKAVCKETSIIPTHLFPGLIERELLPNALYPMYQKSYGITIAKANENIRSVAATEQVAKIFEVKIGMPVLEVTRRAEDIQGRIVELRISHFMTDDFQYEVSLK
ncbi:MAG: GntR family transcriptional regulator [Nitratireductor sp.]